MLRIVVDSTCDLPRTFAEKYGILVLPLHVIVGEHIYLDRRTISTKEVYELMRKGVMPSTSQVNQMDTEEILEDCLRQGDDLLYLAFSGKMSGNYGAVSRVMGKLAESYPERRMRALDSKGGSFATGLIAMEAAKAARDGMAFDALTDRCEFLTSPVEHVFVISDLNWMVRGGRISRTMGYTANLLDIKPVLDVSDGEMEVIRKVRGRLNSMRRVADIVAERAVKCPRQTIGITHADDIKAADTMQELLRERLPECTFLTEEIGAVLGVHLGIGGVGVFFFNKM